MKYLVVIEKTRTGFSAYSPDLDGCVAAARTRPAVRRLMQTAIAMHIEGLREDGRKPPKPNSTSDYVIVPR
jgi:predicted RNase H-like HicB family nuclease